MKTDGFRCRAVAKNLAGLFPRLRGEFESAWESFRQAIDLCNVARRDPRLWRGPERVSRVYASMRCGASVSGQVGRIDLQGVRLDAERLSHPFI